MQNINDEYFLYLLENDEVKLRNEIDKILLIEKQKINQKEALIRCLECLDFTSLDSKDNDESVLKLIENSNTNIPNVNVAGICVYSNFINILTENLKNKYIKKICVAGAFPSGQSPLEIKLQEIKYVLDKDADEVDIVINRGDFFAGKFDNISREISLAKNTCKNKVLKVILEVGELESYSNIFKASNIVLESGADFIKTSTGKISKGADIYSFSCMLLSIRLFYTKTNNLRAIKSAGGISTIEQTLDYFTLFRYFISDKDLTKNNFRIGGSRLKETLVKSIVS